MVEIKSTIELTGAAKDAKMKINVVARRYTNGHKTSYAAEFEIHDRPTNMTVRKILSISVGTFASSRGDMIDTVDSDFMSRVRSSDHIVMDTSSMDGYMAKYMAKADSVKVYVLCYSLGYTICVTDADLTSTSCMVAVNSKDLCELTNALDVVVAEMLIDGSLVYTDTLAMNGINRLPEDMDRTRWPVMTLKPNFNYRAAWESSRSRADPSSCSNPRQAMESCW